MKKISVTDIKGFKIGNAENSEKGTGCTVIVCEEGAVGGVDVRGGGPATRETDLLRSENTVNAVNAVVLSGGSAFGLEAASGVMRELADRRIGFDAGDDIVVPIVCGASLYDLPVGDSKAFPDVYMGAQAVRNAYDSRFVGGNHGAGTGATVGKIKGYGRAMKSGLGTFACSDGILDVGAIAAVNAVGDIYNGAGNIIAGLRSQDGKSIYGTIKTLKGMVHDQVKLYDDGTMFISRSEIDEALAAAAKQYEEQEAEAEKTGEPAAEVSETPAVEPASEEMFTEEIPAAEPVPEEQTEEVFAEEPYEVFSEAPEVSETPAEEPEIFEAPADGFTEEAGTCETPVEEAPAEEFCEKPETFEEPAEDFSSMPETEEAYEEPAAEELIQEEEFIPETPDVNRFSESYMEYAEVSIPETTAEPEYFEEPVIFEVPAEETEIFEEPAEDIPAEETFEEPAEEEQIEEFAEEPEVSAAPTEEPEVFEAPVEEPEIFEAPVEDTQPEEFVPAEAEVYIPEETSAEETFEAPAEEEPVILSREDMGYDITFNTTISCLITNAALTKSQANKLASILHDAYARAIKPVHGTLDGDTVFVLATGELQVNFDAFAALATDIMQYAIIDGAMSAEAAYGLPAARDMQKTGE